MIEQDLAAAFRDFAKELRNYREELVSFVPEGEERCAPLDELVEYLEGQSHTLLTYHAGGRLV